MNIQQRAQAVLDLLKIRYPQPQTHLVAADAWQLLVATVLSAQCTDARVNMVTPKLFALWPGPAALARADLAAVEAVIHSTGFYHNKAKNIIGAAQAVMERFGGQVPDSLAALITLPGVARKTANVVLWGAFGRNEGLAVDTHVKRICLRLGLTQESRPEAVEQDLMALFPQEDWGMANHRLVWFGRQVCDARKPLCSECELRPLCKEASARLKA